MSLLDLVRAQYKTLPIPLNHEDCEGRTFIVTGANSGLGLECARHLTRLGSARVIIAVRNLESGEAARAGIEGETGRRGVVQVWHIDLAKYESVGAFAKRAEAELDRVDGLVENAALANGYWAEAEGNEVNLTVNLFSTILLALLMLPQMEKAAKKFGIMPRIAIIGSEISFHAKPALSRVDMDDILGDLRNRKKWEPDVGHSYPLTKLLLHFAFLELARRAPVSRTGVVINLGNPGICYSGIIRYASYGVWLQVSILRLLLGRSSEVGSRTLLHGIAVGEEAHGKYLTDCEISQHMVPDWVTDEYGKGWQARVWEQVVDELERAQPGCLSGLSSE